MNLQESYLDEHRFSDEVLARDFLEKSDFPEDRIHEHLM